MEKNVCGHGSIICNGCGQAIAQKSRSIPEADWLDVQKSWGYFSNKDGKRHSFRICEACYDKWINSFALPVEVSDETELLLP